MTYDANAYTAPSALDTRTLGRGVATFAALSVAALGILLIANVFARTFFQSIYFAEEVSMFLVMLTTFTGVSYGVRKARHIRMGAFLDAMPPKMEKIF